MDIKADTTTGPAMIVEAVEPEVVAMFRSTDEAASLGHPIEARNNCKASAEAKMCGEVISAKL